jgi:hypothetical protein
MVEPVKIASGRSLARQRGRVAGARWPVWLFYVVRYGETWSTSRSMNLSRPCRHLERSLRAVDRSGHDGAQPAHRAFDRQYLLPVYLETGEDKEVVGPVPRRASCASIRRRDGGPIPV